MSIPAILAYVNWFDVVSEKGRLALFNPGFMGF
jgi:hypothetical protein